MLKIPLFKTICFILILAFSAESALWANPDILAHNSPPSFLQVPDFFRADQSPIANLEFALVGIRQWCLSRNIPLDELDIRLTPTINRTRLLINLRAKKKSENDDIIIPCAILAGTPHKLINAVIPKDPDKPISFLEADNSLESASTPNDIQGKTADGQAASSLPSIKDDGAVKEKRFNRRRFFKYIGLGAGGIAAGSVAVAALRDKKITHKLPQKHSLRDLVSQDEMRHRQDPISLIMEPETYYDFMAWQGMLAASGKELEFGPGNLYHGQDNLDEAIISGKVGGEQPLEDVHVRSTTDKDKALRSYFTRVAHEWATQDIADPDSKSPAIYMIDTKRFNNLVNEGKASFDYIRSVSKENPAMSGIDPYPNIIGDFFLDIVSEIWVREDDYRRYMDLVRMPDEKARKLPERDRILREKVALLLEKGIIMPMPDLNRPNLRKIGKDDTHRIVRSTVGLWMHGRGLLDKIPVFKAKNEPLPADEPLTPRDAALKFLSTLPKSITPEEEYECFSNCENKAAIRGYLGWLGYTQRLFLPIIAEVLVDRLWLHLRIDPAEMEKRSKAILMDDDLARLFVLIERSKRDERTLQIGIFISDDFRKAIKKLIAKDYGHEILLNDIVYSYVTALALSGRPYEAETVSAFISEIDPAKFLSRSELYISKEDYKTVRDVKDINNIKDKILAAQFFWTTLPGVYETLIKKGYSKEAAGHILAEWSYDIVKVMKRLEADGVFDNFKRLGGKKEEFLVWVADAVIAQQRADEVLRIMRNGVGITVVGALGVWLWRKYVKRRNAVAQEGAGQKNEKAIGVSVPKNRAARSKISVIIKIATTALLPIGFGYFIVTKPYIVLCGLLGLGVIVGGIGAVLLWKRHQRVKQFKAAVERFNNLGRNILSLLGKDKGAGESKETPTVITIADKLSAIDAKDIMALELEDIRFLAIFSGYVDVKDNGEVHLVSNGRDYMAKPDEDTLSIKVFSPGESVSEGHIRKFERSALDEKGQGLFDETRNRIVSIGRMPIHRVLKALGLDKIRFDRPPDEIALDGGLKVYELELPKNDRTKLVPEGLEILQYELAPVQRFKFLYSFDNKLLAVVPVLDEELTRKIQGLSGYAEALNKGVETFYLDLSDYYVDIPRYDEAWDSQWFEWKLLQQCIKLGSDKLHIRTYLQQYGESQPVYRSMLPHSFYRKPLVYTEIKEDGSTDILEFDFRDFARLKERLRPKEGLRQVIFPIFPTVYPPVFKESSKIDKEHEIPLLFNNSKFDLKNSERTLVIGPGTGIEAWIAWLITKRDIYVAGINPLEVANTLFLGELVGAKFIGETNDGVIMPDGRPVFGGGFDRVIWDMPIVTSKDNTKPKVGGYFCRFWDLDPGGALVQRFAKTLDKVMKPEGKALIWNMEIGLDNPNHERGVDFVTTVFQCGGNLDRNLKNGHVFDVEIIDEYQHLSDEKNAADMALPPLAWYLVAAAHKEESAAQPLTAPSPADIKHPFDIKDEEILIDSVVDNLASASFPDKKVVLAFHETIGQAGSGKLTTLLRRLDDLKKEKKFELFLQNLVIIPSFNTQAASTGEKDSLSMQLEEHGVDINDSEHCAVFAFMPSQSSLSAKGPAMHEVLVDDRGRFNPEIYYYPLFEMILLTLLRYHEGLDREAIYRLMAESGTDLKELNIEDINDASEKAFLIFTLLPKLERYTGEGVERYTRLMRAIDICA